MKVIILFGIYTGFLRKRSDFPGVWTLVVGHEGQSKEKTIYFSGVCTCVYKTAKNENGDQQI